MIIMMYVLIRDIILTKDKKTTTNYVSSPAVQQLLCETQSGCDQTAWT